MKKYFVQKFLNTQNFFQNFDSSVINSGDTEEEPGGRNTFRSRKGFVIFLGIIVKDWYGNQQPRPKGTRYVGEQKSIKRGCWCKKEDQILNMNDEVCFFVNQYPEAM